MGNMEFKGQIKGATNLDYMQYGAGTLGKGFSPNAVLPTPLRPDASASIGGVLKSTGSSGKNKRPDTDISFGAYVGSISGIRAGLNIDQPFCTFGSKQKLTSVFNFGATADVNLDIISAAKTDSYYVPLRAKAYADFGLGVKGESFSSNDKWYLALCARTGVAHDTKVIFDPEKGDLSEHQTEVLVTPAIKFEYEFDNGRNSTNTYKIYTDLDCTGLELGLKIDISY